MANSHGQITPTGHEGHDHHVLPFSVYMGIYGALLVLTVLTVMVSFWDLGPMSLPAAMFVASIKAALVVGFFMHLRYDNRFFTLIFACTVFFMILFFSFTLFDLGARGSFVQDEKTFSAKLQGAANYNLSPYKLVHAHHGSDSAIKELVKRRKAEKAAAKAAALLAKASGKKATKKVKKSPFADYKAPSAAMLAKAKTLFVAQCASCHGADGRSNTAFAKALPKAKRPRNFYVEKFKRGSDLISIYKTITKGYPPLMAPFVGLPSSQRKMLARYVRHIYVTARMKKAKK